MKYPLAIGLRTVPIDLFSVLLHISLSHAGVRAVTASKYNIVDLFYRSELMWSVIFTVLLFFGWIAGYEPCTWPIQPDCGALIQPHRSLHLRTCLNMLCIVLIVTPPTPSWSEFTVLCTLYSHTVKKTSPYLMCAMDHHNTLRLECCSYPVVLWSAAPTTSMYTTER